MNKWKILGLIILMGLCGYVFKDVFNRNKRDGEKNNFRALPTVIDNKLKVAIMADIHGDDEQLKKMLFKAKNDGVELVILAGDLADGGEKEDLIKIKDILAESGLKYAAIPGDREKNLKIFKDVFGQDYQRIETGGVKFILINNASWQGLGEEQKRWIETEVKDCQERMCLVIMHKALNNLFSTKIMGEGNKKVAGEAEWLKQLFIASGVRRIEAGDLHYATSYELEGIRTDIVGAISREDNLQSSRYTELMISNNIIERRVVEEENDTGN